MGGSLSHGILFLYLGLFWAEEDFNLLGTDISRRNHQPHGLFNTMTDMTQLPAFTRF